MKEKEKKPTTRTKIRNRERERERERERTKHRFGEMQISIHNFQCQKIYISLEIASKIKKNMTRGRREEIAKMPSGQTAFKKSQTLSALLTLTNRI